MTGDVDVQVAAFRHALHLFLPADAELVGDTLVTADPAYDGELIEDGDVIAAIADVIERRAAGQLPPR